MTLNKELIPKGFFRRTQENGEHKVYKPEPHEIDLCHYGGKVRDRPDSWVAISTCDGISGVIFDGVEMHYIEKLTTESEEFNHILYKHSDIAETNKTCGYSGNAADPEKKHNHLRIPRVTTYYK